MFVQHPDPEGWVRAVQAEGYRATVFPLNHEAPPDVVRAYRDAANAADILIAEVGAWSNPISPDDEVRKQAIAYCQAQLALAEEIGARVCVNIAGSRGEQWDGPHPDNFSDDTFALIVDTVREIIDAVRPVRTCFALETMPWALPDSPDTYLDILRAVDRPALAVHLDPVNMITSPRRYYRNGEFIRECFRKLGPFIRSCHGKDITLGGKLTVHLSETIPGTGHLDYEVFLTELDRLHPDTPLLLEHLSSPEEYRQAAAYVRQVAARIGVSL